MSRQVISLSQMLEKENRKRDNILTVMSSHRPPHLAQTKRASTGPTNGITPQQKQNMNIQSMYRNAGLSIVGQQNQYVPDEFHTQSQPMRYSGSSQQTAYTSEEAYSQSQTTSLPFSQDEALPLPTLLHSRYSKMLQDMETPHFRQPEVDAQVAESEQGTSNSSIDSKALGKIREQQRDEEAQQFMLNFQKLQKEKQVRREEKEKVRLQKEAEKLARRRAKDRLEQEKEALKQAQKDFERQQHQAEAERKEMRKREKHEKELLEHQAKLKAETEQRLAKEARSNEKKRAAEEKKEEILILKRQLASLESQREEETALLSRLMNEITALSNSVNNLFEEKRKLTKLLEDYKSVVRDGTAQISENIATIARAIAKAYESFENLVPYSLGRDKKRSAQIEFPEDVEIAGSLPHVNYTLSITENTFSRTPSTPFQFDAASSDEMGMDYTSFGSALALDMIQQAREKKRRKQYQ